MKIVVVGASGTIGKAMERRGMDRTPGMPARTLAGYHASAAEGTMTGTIIDSTT